MLHKVSELEGALLDAAVAKAEGLQFRLYDEEVGVFRAREGRGAAGAWFPFRPSSQWADGGPIIERERINVKCWRSFGDVWQAGFVPEDAATVHMKGPTPLIAAMLAYVASKFDETVELVESR